MALPIKVDGAEHSGTYRCECVCGQSWSGRGEGNAPGCYSPCLPIAEAVTHMRQEHNDARFELVMSDRFKAWLISYWERASLRYVREHTPVDTARSRGVGR